MNAEAARVKRIVDRLTERNLVGFLTSAARLNYCTPEQALSRSKLKSHVAARRAMFTTMHDETHLSWTEIAAIFETTHGNIVHLGSKQKRQATRAKDDAERATAKEIARWLRAHGVDAVIAGHVESMRWKEGKGKEPP